jgi:cytoskeletal protein CcmA (bactofilin family)
MNAAVDRTTFDQRARRAGNYRARSPQSRPSRPRQYARGLMFTRNSSTDPLPLEPLTPSPSTAVARPPSTNARPTEAGKSVIGNDLRIIGQSLTIISRGTLQVDGEVEGDVGGAEIIIGEAGKVTGTVAAERVIVRGRVSGVIRAMTVALQPTARVEGDIHHMSLAIEDGAEFDGRCRRPADPSELQLDLDARG